MTDDEELRPVRAVYERLARIEERMEGKLSAKDAQRFYEDFREADDKMGSEFLDRLRDFRSDVRKAFENADKEHAAATFRANTESEARLMTAFTALLDARQPEKRSGMHPVIPYGVGGSVVSTAVLTVLWALGLIPTGAH